MDTEALKQGWATLDDGRQVRLRPMYISDKLALEEIETGGERPMMDLVRELQPIIEPAVLETTWGGPVTEMVPADFFGLFAQWALIAEADALDPTNGSDSETSPLPLPSPPAADAR